MKTKKYHVTPIGAAIVECLPDQKKKRFVENNFRRYDICPSSALFTEKEVVDFYHKQGRKVVSCSPVAKE